MARPRSETPSYLHHKASGRARAVWTDTSGARRDRLLPGPFGSKESKDAHARLILELSASPAAPLVADRSGVSINEVMLAYLEHAESYYVDPDGKPSKEFVCMKAAVKPVRELCGFLPTAQFGPLALRTVRQKLVEDGLCRSNVNHRIDRVKRVFRWAASEELVPVATYESLRTLPGLRKGKSEARESSPVKPVAEDVVKATLPFLPVHVRAIIELIQHTGMRPAEACAMTLGQIDRSGETWLYHPTTHKTAHAGKTRVIPLGPKARRVLVEFLRGRSLDPDAPLFSPRRAREERFAAMRKARKTKVQPSQFYRKKRKPKRQPAIRYSPTTISHAVNLAVKKAGVPNWFPYQLRHSYASEAFTLARFGFLATSPAPDMPDSAAIGYRFSGEGKPLSYEARNWFRAGILLGVQMHLMLFFEGMGLGSDSSIRSRSTAVREDEAEPSEAVGGESQGPRIGITVFPQLGPDHSHRSPARPAWRSLAI